MAEHYEPSSIADDVPIIDTPSGPKPSGVPDADAYFAKVIPAGDGATTVVGTNQVHLYDERLASVSWPAGGGGATTIHPRDAAMLGMYSLLADMTWQSWDLAAIAEGRGQPNLTVHKLEEIVLDWPEWDATEIPVGRALVTSLDDAVWESGSRNPFLIEKSANVYGPGTVLRYLGEVQANLIVMIMCAHKDLRRGLEARLTAMLAAERVNDRYGRRVVVPGYFGREVVFRLRSSSRPDGVALAGGGRWPLEVVVAAEVEQVELIRMPGLVQGTAVDVEAT